MNITELAQVVRPMTDQQRNSILFWLGVILVVVIAGFVAIMLLRRKLRAEESSDNAYQGGFLLSDLRKMRDNGEITLEEYELTRAKVLAKAKAKAAESPPPKPKQNPNPLPPELQDPESQ